MFSQDQKTCEHALRFLDGLSQDEEDTQRAAEFRKLVRKSTESRLARETATGVYHLAALGEKQISSFHDTQMLLTAIEENPALLPLVEGDIERLIQRWEASGKSPYRSTWDFVRRRMARKNEPERSV